MKNLILIAFSFFLLLQNGIGQSDPLLIKHKRLVFDHAINDFRVQSEEKYEHDAFGNVIFLEKKNYSSNQEIELWRGLFYDYDQNQLLKKLKYRQYKESVDLWITDFWYEYNYDDNGCLMERNFISNIGGGGIKSKIEYERDEECRMLSTSKLYRTEINEPFTINSYILRDYHSDGISYNELDYKKSPTADSLYLKYEEQFIINDFGKTSIQYWKANNEEQTISSFWKNSFEYDDHENLISKKGYMKNSDTAEWILSTELNYYLDYDENDFLVESRKEYLSHETNPPTVNPSFSRTILYKNSCEGVPEEINSVYETTVRIKEENVYQGANECFDLEKLDLQISISPNPSQGEIQITSPIFKTGNTEILIFATNGKVLLQTNEKSRCESSFIDLTSMKNGIYILQLQNGDHFINEKIVITN